MTTCSTIMGFLTLSTPTLAAATFVAMHVDTIPDTYASTQQWEHLTLEHRNWELPPLNHKVPVLTIALHSCYEREGPELHPTFSKEEHSSGPLQTRHSKHRERLHYFPCMLYPSPAPYSRESADHRPTPVLPEQPQPRQAIPSQPLAMATHYGGRAMAMTVACPWLLERRQFIDPKLKNSM